MIERFATRMTPTRSGPLTGRRVSALTWTRIERAGGPVPVPRRAGSWYRDWVHTSTGRFSESFYVLSGRYHGMGAVVSPPFWRPGTEIAARLPSPDVLRVLEIRQPGSVLRQMSGPGFFIGGTISMV